MTKTSKTAQFSNVNLVYNYFWKGDRYSVEQSEFRVRYEDHLGFIKSYLSANHEDDFSDFDGQSTELKSDTLSFDSPKSPLEENNFDSEMQGVFFDQPFSQVQNVTTYNLLAHLNYQKTSALNHLKKIFSDSDLTFSLVSVKKILLLRNEAKLILGLIYVLMIWFDLSMLDLHRVFRIFVKFN